MKRRIIFATGNEGKMREIRLILADPNLEILSMKEAMAEVEIIEDGTTFAENAEIKARAVWKITGGIVMADDSGLVVDYLNGEPGIYSARYLGEDTPYEVKNRVILERLKSAVGDARSARFISAIVAILPDGKALTTQGEVEGLIAEQPAGVGGFGYDPIFYLPEYGMTSAELPMEQKNAISHRGKALQAMGEKLKAYDGEEAQ
ncbi:MAG: RdgB/HAM1 family non-canonical purine NTP pyrophosphatase [Hungatella sp.]